MQIDSTFSPKFRNENGAMGQAFPRARLAGRRRVTRDVSRARKRSTSRSRSMAPSRTSEIPPVSSETTIATESFSSVTPRAAR